MAEDNDQRRPDQTEDSGHWQGRDRRVNPASNADKSQIFQNYREIERRQYQRQQSQDQIEDQAVRDLLSRAGWVADNEHDQREFGELMDWLRGLKKGDFNTLLVWARDAKARMDAEKAAHDRMVARRSVFLAWLGGGVFMSVFAFFLPSWWDAISGPVSRLWAAVRRLL
jgi:hypothetical protein